MKRYALCVPPLFDLCFLSTQVAQVVKLGPTDVAAGHDLDVVDDRRVHREGSLDADLEADLTHGEGLANAVTLATDDDALENLDPRARALDDVHVHLDVVTGTEIRNVGAEGCCIHSR